MNMLHGFDCSQLPWHRLVHWHGRATAVPAQIEALWQSDAQGRREAAQALARALEHQDSVMQVAPFAVQHMLARWSALAATGVAPHADGLLAVLAPIGGAKTYQQLVHGPQAWGQGFAWRDFLDADQIWPEHVSEAEDERRWDAITGGEIRDMWQDWQRVTAERLLAWAPTIHQAATLARPLERREGDAPPRRRGKRPRFDLRGTPSRQVLYCLARLQRARVLLSV